MTLDTPAESNLRSGKLGYRPALDGVRALAITAVVLNHTTGFPSAGYLGVDIFFVLSGFLITTLLLDEHARNGRVSIGAFYRRRALRLLPALFVLLGVFLAASLAAVLVRGGSLDRAIVGVSAGVGYFTNLAIATEAGARAMPSELVHLWSLAAEEQFYIVWPAALFLALRARKRLALAVLGSGIVLTVAEQLRLYLDGATWARMGFGIDTRSTSILVGCLLALLLATAARPRLDALATRTAPAFLAGLVVLLVVDWGRLLFVGPLLLVAIVAALLIVRALDDQSLIARMLSVSPMVFLGRISYSLYLWHVPVLFTLGLSASRFELLDIPALALAVACATASYYFVEVPFLRRKRKLHADVGAPSVTGNARLAEPKGVIVASPGEAAA